jgi:nicotinamide-nucleotide adenylyltransferase
MYQPKLNPSRGMMIEKFQPITRLDVDLAKHILQKHDELVVCIGSAEKSHEPGYLMTAGERMEFTDLVLKAEGLDPNRYILLPIEDAPDATQWVADVMMTTPRWDTFYTRNFKNATMFGSFQHKYGYGIERIAAQKDERDLFALLAADADGSNSASGKLEVYLPEYARNALEDFGISDRANVIYNRALPSVHPLDNGNRILFLGGLQPLTGCFEDYTGHIGVIQQALKQRPHVVIAVGSAQQSHSESDPLTAGKRIEVIRYALQANGVDARNFSIVPIKDISANACYSTKVIAMCPSFNAAIAGNDWTKELFEETNCEIIPIERGTVANSQQSLSASYVRKTAMQILLEYAKHETPCDKGIARVNEAIGRALDPATKDILKEVGFYKTLHFLAHAKE